jgi:hypothetical protein
VDFSAALNKAMNAAAGEVGMNTLGKAVDKIGGKAAYAKLQQLKRDLRSELGGGNIVKGPRADVLRQRAIDAGLLPGKPPADNKAIVDKYADRNVKSLISGYNLVKRVGGFETNANEIKIALAERGVDIKDLPPPPKPKSLSLRSLGSRSDAVTFDKAFDKLPATDITIVGDKSYNSWKDSRGEGSKELGAGSYGTVMKDSSGKYAVKRGDISSTEAQLIDKVGKAGIGPQLIAANVNGPGSTNSVAVDIRKGRIAMSIVTGTPIGTERNPDDTIGGTKVADAYWEARAKLHRMNIAHNDMHVGNVLIDKSGKAKFVDLGLAQEGPKFALAEAMGAFAKPKGSKASEVLNAQGKGDWQIRQWDGTGGVALNKAETQAARNTGKDSPETQKLREISSNLAKVYENKTKVWAAMRKDGLSDDDIATVMEHGIRSSAMSYTNGVWKKMSDEQAERYITTLYEGI